MRTFNLLCWEYGIGKFIYNNHNHEYECSICYTRVIMNKFKKHIYNVNELAKFN